MRTPHSIPSRALSPLENCVQQLQVENYSAASVGERVREWDIEGANLSNVPWLRNAEQNDVNNVSVWWTTALMKRRYWTIKVTNKIPNDTVSIIRWRVYDRRAAMCAAHGQGARKRPASGQQIFNKLTCAGRHMCTGRRRMAKGIDEPKKTVNYIYPLSFYSPVINRDTMNRHNEWELWISILSRFNRFEMRNFY